jgi:TolB-like protein/Tfp pilus assembly protein PilF
MATVYLTRDLKHDRPVALKVLHRELAAALGPERFLREIRLAARLQHPHILTVLDSGEAAGLLWYTMPYVEGESLRGRLQREKQLPLGDAVRIATEAALALDYAHRHGVVHRDIKPENILLSEGQALIADFGVARGLEEGSEGRLTETGMAVGTPAYMSPEQATAGQVDGRSDVYALGCVLYEMLAGEPPFTAPTPQAVIAKRLIEPVPHLRALRDVPAAVEEAATRALARAPADRFPTAGEFARALSTPPGSSSPALARRLRRVATPAVVALFLAMLGWWVAGRTAPGAPAEPTGQKSIAVLPFVNMSPERENEYFSDGMTEELITALSKVEGLRVAARTSAFVFKGKNADISEIGRRLKVGTVLEGSVRKAGNRMRITAQLIDARGGYHLWSDAYERELRDIFAVQEEIARAIVGALKVRLAAESGAPLVKPTTADLEAYHLFLQGRYFWNQRTEMGLRRAAEYFERAIQRDSTFAAAYAGLADVYVVLPHYSDVSGREAYPRAMQAVTRALDLDSTLAEAYTSLAALLADWRWDWAGSSRAYRRAIELNPGYPNVRHWYGEYLGQVGLPKEAVEELGRAQELDPLSRIIGSDLAWALYLDHRYDSAIAQARRTLELDPNFPPAHVQLVRVYLAQERITEAMAELQRAVKLAGRIPSNQRLLAYAYGRSGQRQKALSLINEFRERWPDEPASIALAYVGLGQREQAFRWLDQAVEERDGTLTFLIFDPLLDPLRSDPRFSRVLSRMGLPERDETGLSASVHHWVTPDRRRLEDRIVLNLAGASGQPAIPKKVAPR